jgi:hypothetical protein
VFILLFLSVEYCDLFYLSEAVWSVLGLAVESISQFRTVPWNVMPGNRTTGRHITEDRTLHIKHCKYLALKLFLFVLESSSHLIAAENAKFDNSRF